MSSKCRCGVHDWKALRLALGLTQETMGGLVGLSKRQIANVEGTEHRCPHKAVVILVQCWMQDPLARERLKAAGYPLEDS